MLTNVHGGYLYMTVNADGLISLWDDQETAMAVKDEQVVALKLSSDQLFALTAAKHGAYLQRKYSDEFDPTDPRLHRN